MGGPVPLRHCFVPLRQGALSVHQFEILPRPPEARSPLTLWPLQLRTESAHEEGGIR
jgi:glutamate synthase (NADPH/NADH) small chain